MIHDAGTLGFGVTFDTVATETACGQLLSVCSHRCGDATPPHAHVNDYVCIVLTGGFAEEERKRCHERRGGSYFTYHAGEMHHDRYGAYGATCLNLHFPQGETGPTLEGICAPETVIAVGQLAFELAAGGREELVMASLAAEIMAHLGPAQGFERDRGRWIGEIVDAILQQPGRRWTLRELAAIAGRHPVHVAQAFRARTGLSLGKFQRLRRLTALSLSLRKEQSPLAILAADYGYYDQSHMNAEFRAAFGMSPSRYRRQFH